MMDAFSQWLETEDGKRCAEWPITGPNFLRNRLWWAYQAGREAVESESKPDAAAATLLREALWEMTHTTATRNSYTDCVDKIDAFLMATADGGDEHG